ncbi:Thioredoxin C-1 [Slackia heliotrinireducens]|uniref:Thioredoxin n=1 Tax=Slackia heliotrinireducens (strain ATCC 29202 / DSM 20476 / NCTC 11029 / RHS 1) TaxID=471855 RepID=C7N6B3_SLAHD|nr:thioredoxin [Slackia heliotrinireducens]ACV22448.1 thioredoxin [Slackia heliotrinireducens DSM 20476]VEH00808.1 Thioredoxin C-1 [Slackia heliotrinireducens]
MADVISSAEFEEKVLKATEPVIVDLFATWCGPCKAMAPTLDKVAAEHADEVSIYKVDVDESPEIAQKFRVMSVPTLLAFKNGELVNRAVGAQPEDAIVALFK